MRLINLNSRVSTLSMILGTLTVISISTQKTDAAITWSKTECKVRCNKYMAGNMKKNLNECARNCDNGDIKDILIKNCAVLEDKQKLNDALSKQKLGYEGEKQANQIKIDQFKNASDYRGKKLTKEYIAKDAILNKRIKDVEAEKAKCPVSTDSAAAPAATTPAAMPAPAATGAPAVPPVPPAVYRAPAVPAAAMSTTPEAPATESNAAASPPPPPPPASPVVKGNPNGSKAQGMTPPMSMADQIKAKAAKLADRN